jgi:7-cyano-7-deazaguanine reductase
LPRQQKSGYLFKAQSPKANSCSVSFFSFFIFYFRADMTVKYGEQAIAEVNLTTFPNPRIGRDYKIQITLPEFTSKCPFSGYPDFATIYISYTPNLVLVELKAIKLYINSYRDLFISHEEAVNQILDDFVKAGDPLRINVKGDFTPRGNVHTVVEVNYSKPQETI